KCPPIYQSLTSPSESLRGHWCILRERWGRRRGAPVHNRSRAYVEAQVNRCAWGGLLTLCGLPRAERTRPKVRGRASA
ncbi:unnamed protein product, partial [Mycena citricolor]